MLHRAISNLVLNAIDAITAGGRLAVSTRQDRERTLIRISDSGAGLTAQECSQLFTPYYTTKKHGTGLGLAIVQSVISDHGGKVTVQSEPGQGATFIIDMPNGFQKLPLGNTSSFSH
jgi:signal transduction histidine kinase